MFGNTFSHTFLLSNIFGVFTKNVSPKRRDLARYTEKKHFQTGCICNLHKLKEKRNHRKVTEEVLRHLFQVTAKISVERSKPI